MDPYLKADIPRLLNCLDAVIALYDYDGNAHDITEAERIAASTERGVHPHPVGLAEWFIPHTHCNGVREPIINPDEGQSSSNAEKGQIPSDPYEEQPLFVARRLTDPRLDSLKYYGRQKAGGGNVEPSNREVQQPGGRELQEPVGSESAVRREGFQAGGPINERAKYGHQGV